MLAFSDLIIVILSVLKSGKECKGGKSSRRGDTYIICSQVFLTSKVSGCDKRDAYIWNHMDLAYFMHFIAKAMAMDLKLWIVVVADLGTLLLALLLGVSILSPNLWQNSGSNGFLTVSRTRRFRRLFRQYEQFS